jgi:hypothetical protein
MTRDENAFEGCEADQSTSLFMMETSCYHEHSSVGCARRTRKHDMVVPYGTRNLWVQKMPLGPEIIAKGVGIV